MWGSAAPVSAPSEGSFFDAKKGVGVRSDLTPNAAKAKYEPTSEERTAIDKFEARKAASRAPRLKVLN
jgi:hypothetical protein